MSIDKYKFISPGVFVSEIDNTGRTATPEDIGPVIIGRSEKGPLMQPVKVNSYFDFIAKFGAPVPGLGGVDVSRDGNHTAPTYGAYAAQAWFRNNAPITFVRLGGRASPRAVEGNTPALAGWRTTDLEPATSADENGGAYGLFVADAPTASTLEIEVAAVAALGDTVVFSLNGGADVTITGHAGASTATNFNIGASAAATATGIKDSLNLNTNWLGTATVRDNVYVVLTPGTGLPTLVSASIKVDSPGNDYKLQKDSVDVANDTSASVDYSAVTGTLAAVWYLDQSASIGLSGSRSDTGAAGCHSSYFIDSVGNKQFKVRISSSVGDPEIDSSFNFSDQSDQYIRKVFNTNPVLTNSNVTDNTSTSFTRYWLGESYDGSVDETLSSTGDAGAHVGVILPLQSGSVLNGGSFRKNYQAAKTGYFFSQDLAVGSSATGSFDVTSMQKLFRLVVKDSGAEAQRQIKVSIQDLKASPLDSANPYGTFTVAIRKMSDTDNRPEFVEQFNNCNLNPDSENFILRKIGNKRQEWDEDDRRYKYFGDYESKSNYIWVDMPEAVRKGDTDARYLPFGVQGPIRWNSFDDDTSTGVRNTLVSGNLDDFGTSVTGFASGATDGQILFEFPELRLRISGSEGDPVDPTNSYYGVDTTFNSSRLNRSTLDYLKVKAGSDTDDYDAGTNTSVSWNFTLDDMCMSGSDADKKVFAYKAGSRANTANRGGLTYLRGTDSYKEVLSAGVDRFTTVFAGGFDGLDITESEPLRIVNELPSGADTIDTNYMLNSVQGALDSIRDPEIVEYNLALMPGIKNTNLNRSLIELCEDRGDALAIVDLKGGYTPVYESTDNEDARKGTVDATTTEVDNLQVNSSYGATYYPWVHVRDTNSGKTLWMPPSVIALGAMSYSQKQTELWFAPAGFTRGGLSTGRAGLPVVGVRDRLTSKDRDKLYDAGVNPIAQFPAEGIVIFGQKTMQLSASALDRINVRRLMIFLKRQISRFASTILFDQNVRVTWNRFKGQAEPFLRGVQAGLGITEFKMVLDDTTTTPDLVDRNIMYAKIFIKPARAIEYIAIDFILTDSGAAFED